jgi:hypothetical protein
VATVVDSLVVTLSIDSTGFDKGFRDAIDALNRVKVEQVKIGAAIEESGKRVAGTFTQIRNEALALFAVLLGAHGLKDFTTGLMESNVQLGRLATNLGAAPQWLSAWGMLAERAGGSTEQTAASFERIAKTLYELRNSGGGIPREVLMMQNLATTKIDWEHGPVKYFETMARVIQEANKVNPGDTYFFAKAAGFDDATYNAIIRADKALTGLIASKEKLAWSDAALTQAGKMTDAFFDLRQELSSLAGTIVEEAGPAIVDLLKWLDEMVRSNSADIKGGIVQGVKDFSGWIKTIRWDDVKNTFHDIAKGANDIANALGGVVRVSEVLIGLWAGAKVVNAGRAIGSLIGAGLGVAGAAGGAFSWLTGLGGGTASSAGGGAAAAGGIGVLSRMFALTAPLLLGGDTATPDPTDTDRKKAKAAEDAYTKEHGSFWHQMGSYFGISAGASEANGPRTDMPAGFNQGGQFGRTPPGGYNASQFLDLTVEGRTISRANPLPVMLTGPGASGPQSLWEWLFGKSDGSGSGGGGSGSTGSGDGRTWLQKLFGIGGATHHGASSTLRARGTAGGGMSTYEGVYAAAKAMGDPYPEVTAAQWALESGWGKHTSGKNNYFGQTEHGIIGQWANYDSPEDGLKAHLSKWMPKYAGAKNSDEAIDRLIASNYAHDTGYKEALQRIIKEHPVTMPDGSIAGDLSGQSTYPRKGEPLDEDAKGFIWHHTGGRGTPQSVIQTLNARGLGVQYIMDRQGRIFRALPSGSRGAHILPSEINSLSNSNTEGMEVIANDDSDVTAAQIAAAKAFAEIYSKLHPGVQYFGHGEVNPSHKMASEGLTIANAIRAGVALSISRSAPSTVPVWQRTLGSYLTGDFGGSAHAAEMPAQANKAKWWGSLSSIPNGPALSSITNNKPVTTSSTSNAMHIGEMNINAPNATDSTGIAKTIGMALSDYGFVALNDAGTF